MRVRAKQTTYINGVLRNGPEFNSKDEQLSDGDVFDVADNYVVNPEVLEVLVPPKVGKVNYEGAPGEGDDDDGKRPSGRRGKQTAGAGAGADGSN